MYLALNLVVIMVRWKKFFMHQTESSRDYNQNLEYGVDEFYDNGDGTHGLIATGYQLLYATYQIQNRRHFCFAGW